MSIGGSFSVPFDFIVCCNRNGLVGTSVLRRSL